MKTMLFTGASGFLGSCVKPALEAQGFEITTVGITDGDDIEVNIATTVPKIPKKYDVVLHAAGKAHSVPRTAEEEKVFYDVNLEGTKNLCKSLENSGVPQAFIFISTVAVYGREIGENIPETHPLNGTTPYAKSKIMAEQFLQEWSARHGVTLAIIRPSLIAGKNPPGNLGTMINGIRTGRYLSISGGKARKSVLMAEDIANLIPKLAEVGGVYNVCDSHHPSFQELEQIISSQLGTKPPRSIPYWIARTMALVGDLLGSKAPINSLKLSKITKPLTFDNSKAKKCLNWEPLDVVTNFRIS